MAISNGERFNRVIPPESMIPAITPLDPQA
jgi:hypothetical protein